MKQCNECCAVICLVLQSIIKRIPVFVTNNLVLCLNLEAFTSSHPSLNIFTSCLCSDDVYPILGITENGGGWGGHRDLQGGQSPGGSNREGNARR